jgi:MFS family permease
VAGDRSRTRPKQDLKGAVALNSLGINISRAIGPAVGGLLLAWFGAAFTYGVDVISYIFVIAALIWWRRAPDADDGLSESFFGAFRAGLRYARASRELHVVLLGRLHSSLSRVLSGRSCRWSREIFSTATPVSMASCLARSALVPSAVRSSCRNFAQGSMRTR